jgi:hypothetical protein
LAGQPTRIGLERDRGQELHVVWVDANAPLGRALGERLSDPRAARLVLEHDVHYAAPVSSPATLLMWFQLRSPELAGDFERLMTDDRDIVRGSLDTVSDWRLTRPADVPGQTIGQADYVLIAEIVEVERWEQQASEHVQRLTDDLAHLVSSRGMLVVRGVL